MYIGNFNDSRIEGVGAISLRLGSRTGLPLINVLSYSDDTFIHPSSEQFGNSSKKWSSEVLIIPIRWEGKLWSHQRLFLAMQGLQVILETTNALEHQHCVLSAMASQ